MDSYDPATEDWNAYMERFEQYILANDVKDAKKIVAILLTTVGIKTYSLLRDLLTPTKRAIGVQIRRTCSDTKESLRPQTAHDS